MYDWISLRIMGGSPKVGIIYQLYPYLLVYLMIIALYIHLFIVDNWFKFYYNILLDSLK